MCFHENKRDWMDFLLFNVLLVNKNLDTKSPKSTTLPV